MRDEPTWVDGLEPGYRLDDAIAGRVLLTDADSATVALVFETGGRCDPERAVLRDVEIGPGSGWAPFVMDGPCWPPTYHGTLFAGDWYLELAQSIRGERTVVRQMLDISLDDAIEVRPAERKSARPAGAGLGTRLAVLLALELICAALIVVGAVSGSRLWIVGLVAGIVLLLPTAGTALGLLSKRATRGMSVEVAPRAGGLTVRAEFGNGDGVEEVTAALVVRESVQRFTGTDRPDRREHVIHRQQVPLVRKSDRTFSAVLAIPRDVTLPPTFSHSTAQVGWSLHVTAKLRGAPDLERTVALVARPATGPSADVQPRWTTG